MTGMWAAGGRAVVYAGKYRLAGVYRGGSSCTGYRALLAYV